MTDHRNEPASFHSEGKSLRDECLQNEEEKVVMNVVDNKYVIQEHTYFARIVKIILIEFTSLGFDFLTVMNKIIKVEFILHNFAARTITMKIQTTEKVLIYEFDGSFYVKQYLMKYPYYFESDSKLCDICKIIEYIGHILCGDVNKISDTCCIKFEDMMSDCRPITHTSIQLTRVELDEIKGLFTNEHFKSSNKMSFNEYLDKWEINEYPNHRDLDVYKTYIEFIIAGKSEFGDHEFIDMLPDDYIVNIDEDDDEESSDCCCICKLKHEELSNDDFFKHAFQYYLKKNHQKFDIFLEKYPNYLDSIILISYNPHAWDQFCEINKIDRFAFSDETYCCRNELSFEPVEMINLQELVDYHINTCVHAFNENPTKSNYESLKQYFAYLNKHHHHKIACAILGGAIDFTIRDINDYWNEIYANHCSFLKVCMPKLNKLID